MTHAIEKILAPFSSEVRKELVYWYSQMRYGNASGEDYEDMRRNVWPRYRNALDEMLNTEE